MITRIKIDGFKSFQDFEVELAPFTLVAGANGSGKSNLFDALRLLSRLVRMPVAEAFGGQRGSIMDQFTVYDNGERATQMLFEVDVLVGPTVKDPSTGEMVALHNRRLTYELIVFWGYIESVRTLSIGYEKLSPIPIDQDRWLDQFVSIDSVFYKSILEAPKAIVPLKYDYYFYTNQKGGRGYNTYTKKAEAMLYFTNVRTNTHLEASEKPHPIAAKEAIAKFDYLQLEPKKLQLFNDVGGPNKLSETGAFLAANLYQIKQNDEWTFRAINNTISRLLPEFREVEVEEQFNRYVFALRSREGQLFASDLLSEGTLRLIGLITLVYDDRTEGSVALEEPENGIHPFRLDACLELLRNMATDLNEEEEDALYPLRQVIINTHSPALVRMAMENGEDNQVVYFVEKRYRTHHEENHLSHATRYTTVVKDDEKYRYQLPDGKSIVVPMVLRYLKGDVR